MNISAGEDRKDALDIETGERIVGTGDNDDTGGLVTEAGSGAATSPGGGDPGGMGGIATRASASTAGGGVSPIQKDADDRDSER